MYLVTTVYRHNNKLFKRRWYFKVMLQNIPNDKILEIVRQGPTFPAKVAKALGSGGDTMLIGAILSTLISSGDLKVSTLKIGGSPLYYVPEQESKLEDFLSYLNEKDKKTFKLLKEQKILQDSTQDPLTRVSLRAIKDFAKQFEVDYKGQKLLCWRFYSISLEEAQSLAKKLVSIVKSVEVEEFIQEEKETSLHEHKSESKHEHKQEHTPSLIIEPKLVEKIVIEKPSVEHHEEKHVDMVQQILEEQTNTVPTIPNIPVKHEHLDKEKHLKSTKVPKTIKVPKEPKLPKEPKVKEPKSPKIPKLEYNFFELILNHVSSKKLDVISKEKIKKTEYDLVLKNHETNEYIYCKAKDKPTLSEGDLAPAIIFAQNKKMPCLFLSTGDLTKKAEQMIGKDFVGLKFEKIVVSQ
jgi:hypothetical protein